MAGIRRVDLRRGISGWPCVFAIRMQHPSPSKERPGRGRGSPRASIARIGAVVLATLGVAVFAPGAWPLASGESAPACSARLLDGDRSVRLADYHGKVVYLDFWASWCAPCRESFPFMNELQRELGDKGLQILAVSVEKTADEARRFLARYPAQFATALDAPGACPAAYRLEGMPSSYVIGRDGIVRAVHVGFRGGDKTEIRRQVIEALAEGK
jgi:thiol-disulfide isomerase/thioredoxin